jgi:hypothetical protein
MAPRLLSILVLVLSWFILPALLCAEEIVSLVTRTAVTQSYLLANLPQNPRAIAGAGHACCLEDPATFDGHVLEFLLKPGLIKR